MRELSPKVYKEEVDRLAQICRSGQQVSTRDLLTLLNQYGFSYRPGKGDHIVFWHDDLHGIGQTIVGGTKDLRYKAIVADACRAVLERRWKSLNGQEARQDLYPEQFNAVASSVKIDIPERYEVLPYSHEDLLILRHRGRPCIGTVILRQMPADALSDTLSLLDEEVRKLEAQIARAIEMEFEHEPRDDGMLSLINRYSDVRVYYAHFTGKDAQEHAPTDLAETLDKIDQEEATIRNHWQNLNRPDLSNRREVKNSDGRRTIIYCYTNPLTFQTADVQYDLSPKGRISNEAICRFLDDLWFRYWDGIQGNLKNYGGFKTRIAKGSGRKNDLEVSHPVFPDLRFTVNDLQGLSNSLARVAADADLAEGEQSAVDLFLNIFAARDAATAKIKGATAEVWKRCVAPSHRIYALKQSLLHKGAMFQGPVAVRSVPGELRQVFIHHASLPRARSFHEMVIRRPGADDFIPLMTPDDLAKLEQANNLIPDPTPSNIFMRASHQKAGDSAADRIIAAVEGEITRRSIKAGMRP